jgi:hypothetical protein
MYVVLIIRRKRDKMRRRGRDLKIWLVVEYGVICTFLLPCTTIMNTIELKKEKKIRENRDTDLRDSAIYLRPQESTTLFHY